MSSSAPLDTNVAAAQLALLLQSIGTSEIPMYNTVEYWNNRYLNDKGETYDWYWCIDDVLKVLTTGTLDSRILVVGCGNSTLPVRISEKGYKNVTAVDFSQVAIEQMRSKCSEVTWAVADVLDLHGYDDDAFDYVIDVGCLDAVVCGQDREARGRRACAEIWRVTSSSGGRIVMVSHGEPKQRTLYLPHNAASNMTVTKHDSRYLYVFKVEDANTNNCHQLLT